MLVKTIVTRRRKIAIAAVQDGQLLKKSSMNLLTKGRERMPNGGIVGVAIFQQFVKLTEH